MSADVTSIEIIATDWIEFADDWFWQDINVELKEEEDSMLEWLRVQEIVDGIRDIIDF